MNKFTQEKIVAGIAMSVLTASVVAYWFLYQRIEQTYADIETSSKELIVLVEQEGKHDSLVDMLERSEEDRAEIESYILSIDNPTPFLALIDDLADEAGVEVFVESLASESVDTGAEEKDGLENEIVIRTVLVIEGTWQAVYHMLDMLEHIPYIVTINKVALEEEGEGSVVWSGQIHMQILAK